MTRHRRPEGETKRERRLQRVVGIGVAVVFLLLGTIVIQGAIQYRSQTNHHAATEAQQNTIIVQNRVIEHQNKVIESETAALVAFHAQTVTILNQIAELQSEFTQSVGTIPSVSAALKVGQQELKSTLADIDARIVAICAVLPSTVCASP